MIGPRAGFDQADAAEDKRAHDALPKIGLGDQQRAQPLGRNGQGLDVGQRGRVDEVGAARKLREFAHEIAALVGGDVDARVVRVAFVT